MDSLTQIVLGAAAGEAVLGKKTGNKAMLWGAVAGTIPDLDVVSNFFTDTLTANELHRGFSHSIIFCLLFSPLFGFFISKIHKQAGFKEWTKLMFWGLFTHPLLDAHTTWGTQLLWPLEYKISYKNIFVVDPLYTIPFLLFLILAMRLPKESLLRARYNKTGLIISTLYMLLTLFFKGYTYFQFFNSLEKQNVEFIRLENKPTPLNSILWTSTAETDSSFLIGYYSLFDKSDNVSFITFPKNHHLAGKIAGEEKYKRLVKLSENWYTLEQQGDTLVFNDLRFGQTGITGKDGEFVFKYFLFYNNNELQVVQKRNKIEKAGNAFSELWERVKGV